MTEAEFSAALNAALPGQRIAYFTGNLSRARESVGRAASDARCVGDAAWRAYEAGLVSLVQTTDEPAEEGFVRDFTYWAVRR